MIVFTYLALGVSCAAVAASDLQSILVGFGINIHWELIIYLQNNYQHANLQY